MRELLPSREVCKRVLRTPSARPETIVFVAGFVYAPANMPMHVENG
jgi:hypothetical protein